MLKRHMGMIAFALFVVFMMPISAMAAECTTYGSTEALEALDKSGKASDDASSRDDGVLPDSESHPDLITVADDDGPDSGSGNSSTGDLPDDAISTKTKDGDDPGDANAPDDSEKPDAPPEKPIIRSSFDKVDGIWVYYDGEGDATPMPELMPGWVQQEGAWYWFSGADSFVRDDWALVSDVRYRFDVLGHMLVGWFEVDEKRYLAQSSGAVKSGWHAEESSWYYLDPSGAMVERDWRLVGGWWYYLGDEGRMATGWFKDGTDQWYYADGSGAMQTGWICPHGTWYYLQPSGAMQTGWLYSGGVWYYLQPSGAMAIGYVQVDDKTERFDGNGHYRPGLDQASLAAAVDGVGDSRQVTVSGGTVPVEALARIEADLAAIEAQGGSCGGRARRLNERSGNQQQCLSILLCSQFDQGLLCVRSGFCRPRPCGGL